jgi:hypothetical protein
MPRMLICTSLIPVSRQDPEVIGALSQALQAVIDNHEPAELALRNAQTLFTQQLAQASPPPPEGSTLESHYRLGQ